jgi:hypothetical protein
MIGTEDEGVSVYTDCGHKDRNDYLKSLADEYGIRFADVKVMADMLGKDEDFDGLVSELEDICDGMEY